MVLQAVEEYLLREEEEDQENWSKVQINVISGTNKMCLWNTNPLAATKYKLGILSIKVMIEVTRSLTLVWFERFRWVEYVWQY